MTKCPSLWGLVDVTHSLGGAGRRVAAFLSAGHLSWLNPGPSLVAKLWLQLIIRIIMEAIGKHDKKTN